MIFIIADEFKELMQRLMSDPRRERIWTRLMYDVFLDETVYISRVFRERDLPIEKTSFGTKITLLGSFETVREITDENQVNFPHLFVFRLYKLLDKRRGMNCSPVKYFITVAEYIGTVVAIPVFKERPLRVDDARDTIDYLRKELERDINDPLYVVWRHNDPRIADDYFSEVNDIIEFVGYKDEALEYFQCTRSSNYGSWSRVGYPVLRKDERWNVGFKRIIFHEKQRPSNEEGDLDIMMWEIEHGY